MDETFDETFLDWCGAHDHEDLGYFLKKIRKNKAKMLLYRIEPAKSVKYPRIIRRERVWLLREDQYTEPIVRVWENLKENA
jgi:hypothetical protein